jgi:hypothetical protein
MKENEPNKLWVLLNLILPGLGSIILKRSAGVTILVLWLISLPLMFVLIGFLTGGIVLVWNLIEIIMALME